MATQIITCSLPLELGKFLEENQEISPSKVLQEQLFKMRDDESRLNERVKAYEIRNQRITHRLDKILRYVEAQNIAIPDDVLSL